MKQIFGFASHAIAGETSSDKSRSRPNAGERGEALCARNFLRANAEDQTEDQTVTSCWVRASRESFPRGGREQGSPACCSPREAARTRAADRRGQSIASRDLPFVIRHTVRGEGRETSGGEKG